MASIKAKEIEKNKYEFEFLIEKETITGKEFMKIFREVKGLDADEKTEEPKEII